MKAKRSKQYRKLMKQYCRVWNFREPYQVLVDADIVKDASRFKMDLIPALERTLHGKIKPMITQCSMRHLYALQGVQPGMKALIDSVKATFERRRCGHHPDETDALSTLECLSSFVVDSGRGSRNRYVVASQDPEVRRRMRGVRGVPLIYISRSVMIMEPMASGSAEVVSREERAKFRSEIRSLAAPAGSKRKRGDDDGSGGSGSEEDDGDDDDGGGDDDDDDDDDDQSAAAGQRRRGPSSAAVGAPDRKKRKKAYGPKGPNPLAAKKKKKQEGSGEAKKAARGDRDEPAAASASAAAAAAAPSDQPAKKKRKRRGKKTAGSGSGDDAGAGAEAAHAPVSAET